VFEEVQECNTKFSLKSELLKRSYW